MSGSGSRRTHERRDNDNLPSVQAARHTEAALQVADVLMVDVQLVRCRVRQDRPVESATRVRRIARGSNGVGAQVRRGRAIRGGGQVSGGTGVFGTLGYLQREAVLMREERERFAMYLAAVLDDEGVSKALAEVDRRSRETFLTWSAASREVIHEIGAGKVTW